MGEWTKSYAAALTVAALSVAALYWAMGERFVAYACLYLAVPGVLMGLAEGLKWVGRWVNVRRGS